MRGSSNISNAPRSGFAHLGGWRGQSEAGADLDEDALVACVALLSLARTSAAADSSKYPSFGKIERKDTRLDKIVRQMERRRQLADRNTGAVVDLLGRREELRGIYPAADLVAENVGWAV